MVNSFYRKAVILFLIIIILILFRFPVFAQEFRGFNPIPTPGVIGGEVVKEVVPVSQEKVNSLTEDIIKSWGSEDLKKFISEDFYDKQRLVDSFSDKVPRDAKVRIMSVQGGQTLNQYQGVNPITNAIQIISTVSVTATTQIEFNDMQKGFRRLEGTNEYILRITEEVEK